MNTTHAEVKRVDDMYVNIHTRRYPGGELRCNLMEAASGTYLHTPNSDVASGLNMPSNHHGDGTGRLAGEFS
jgi:hypothetical protein